MPTSAEVPGAQNIKPVSVTPCFAAGAVIKTDQGEMAVERITPGTRVLTRDNGYQKVLWVGARRLSAEDLAEAPHLAPINIARGSLGPNMPDADLLVSPQHRMLLCNTQIRRWFQSDEVLIAAQHMTCFPGIAAAQVNEVSYYHFMFAQHEIVLANGAWSESFQPADLSAGTLGEAQRQEILELFPELEQNPQGYAAARETLDPEQVPSVMDVLRKRKSA